jgi:hypothetical protein
VAEPKRTAAQRHGDQARMNNDPAAHDGFPLSEREQALVDAAVDRQFAERVQREEAQRRNA